MNVHLRADEVTPRHIRLTVFCNHGNCGVLCMTQDEAWTFHNHLKAGIEGSPDHHFRSTGDWGDEEA